MAAPQSQYEAAGDASSAFPPFDPTFFASQIFWLAITFIALYALLSRLILPRIGSAIEARRDRIADDLDAAAQMKAQADEAVRAYEQALAEARAKASATAAEAKAEADRLIEEESEALNRELEAKQAEAERRIADAKAKALAEVRDIAAEAAAEAASRLADLEVGAEEARKAVDARREGSA